MDDNTQGCAKGCAYTIMAAIIALILGIIIVPPIVLIEHGHVLGYIWVAVLVCTIVAFFIWLIVSRKKWKIEDEAKQRELEMEHDRCRPTVVGSTINDRFFVECLLTNCYDFSQQKNIERAKIIAQKYRLSYPDGVENLFNKAKENHKIASNSVWKCVRRKERLESAELTRYSNLVGKEKRIAMLTDEMNKLKKEKEHVSNVSRGIMNSSYQESEVDWATLGGIATGIAGAGAGIAVALNAQSENAAIKSRNQARAISTAMLSLQLDELKWKIQEKIDNIINQINETNNKLVQMEPPEKIMQGLSFSWKRSHISYSGAVTISVEIRQEEKMFMYGDVPAYVDGYIVATVFKDRKKIGGTKIVLPLDGTKEGVYAKGICFTDCKVGDEIEIYFEPGNLWLMEK